MWLCGGGSGTDVPELELESFIKLVLLGYLHVAMLTALDFKEFFLLEHLRHNHCADVASVVGGTASRLVQ